MRIEEEIKLDYSDVLFRPKRSTLKSRKEVDLSRTYKFKHSNREWTGIPIIASNMDGVGELKVAKSLSNFNIITALTKQHDLDLINSCVISAVTTFPAIIVFDGYFSLIEDTKLLKFSEYPLATSIQIN